MAQSYPAAEDLPLHFEAREHGVTRVELRNGDQIVSWLWILPYEIRVGAATLRMDGIGGVGTHADCRFRGYSRYVLDRTVRHMEAGDGAVTMLYGIRDFYPKFGYATTGPEHSVHVRGLDPEAPLPSGWSVRPYISSDLPRCREIYVQATAGACGTAVRPDAHRIWARLDRAASPPQEGAAPPVAVDACRVVVGPDGAVHGYAWHCPDHWAVRGLQRDLPEALVLGEILADGPAAADAILAACRRWGAEASGARDQPFRELASALTEEGHVAAAAQLQEGRFTRRFTTCGGSMARVLNLERLLTALLPEFEARMSAANWPFRGVIQFETDLGEARLTLAPNQCRVEPGRGAHTHAVALPQTALARLTLGAFRPEDVCARLEVPVAETAQAVLRLLFPLRQQNMHLPDRY